MALVSEQASVPLRGLSRSGHELERWGVGMHSVLHDQRAVSLEGHVFLSAPSDGVVHCLNGLV